MIKLRITYNGRTEKLDEALVKKLKGELGLSYEGTAWNPSTHRRDLFFYDEKGVFGPPKKEPKWRGRGVRKDEVPQWTL